METKRMEKCIVQKYSRTIWQRISHLRHRCSLLNQSQTWIDTIQLYHWKNINYCKVPKCGSTFWMQVFLVLNKLKNVTEIFGEKRSSQHIIPMTQISTWNSLSGSDVIFHVTRNPYSRLYSAYIDKIFLPGFSKLASDINKMNGKSCNKSVSFEEFLKFILADFLYESHWQPISSMCASCSVPYNVISKQETFNTDVHFILDQLNISNLLKQEFLKNIVKKRTENSVREITKVMIELAKIAPCLTYLQFSKRLWKSFQIQGYISDSVSFPVRKFKSLNFDNVEGTVRAYLEGSKKDILQETKKKVQRQRYLARAFSTLKSRTIQNIQKAYKNDFDLFGYSYDLPKEHLT
ncbi:carbohydrate sulfotransferase 10-like [Saccostrea echinata]|uniref:carbohydrate sulfotransferase 10-like n=1 Tax=Saccostrea echinata TaxID=191078 RepID=UPI002A811E64|nr:carbohydrate sulfotransferase 10-like [Saccostrea echinata]